MPSAVHVLAGEHRGGQRAHGGVDEAAVDAERVLRGPGGALGQHRAVEAVARGTQVGRRRRHEEGLGERRHQDRAPAPQQHVQHAVGAARHRLAERAQRRVHHHRAAGRQQGVGSLRQPRNGQAHARQR